MEKYHLMKNIISVGITSKAEIVFNRTQHPSMVKHLNKLGIEGLYLNIMKAIYDKTIAKIILNGGKLKAFPLIQERRQRYPLLSLFFNTVLEI